MKIEMSDVHPDDLSRFIQRLYYHLQCDTDKFEDVLRATFSDMGLNKSVCHDGSNFWVMNE